MGLRFVACRRCPNRAHCSTLHYAGLPPECEQLQAAQRQADPEVDPDRCELVDPDDPDTRPMTLPEAAAVVIRHWTLLGCRGMEAAITLLRRVLERES